MGNQVISTWKKIDKYELLQDRPNEFRVGLETFMRISCCCSFKMEVPLNIPVTYDSKQTLQNAQMGQNMVNANAPMDYQCMGNYMPTYNMIRPAYPVLVSMVGSRPAIPPKQ